MTEFVRSICYVHCKDVKSRDSRFFPVTPMESEAHGTGQIKEFEILRLMLRTS